MTEDHLEGFGWIELDSFEKLKRNKVRWRDPLTGLVYPRWEAEMVQYARDAKWRRENPRPGFDYEES